MTYTQSSREWARPLSDECAKLRQVIDAIKAQPVEYPQAEQRSEELERQILEARAVKLESDLRDPLISKDEANNLLDELAEVADKMCLVFGSAE